MWGCVECVYGGARDILDQFSGGMYMKLGLLK